MMSIKRKRQGPHHTTKPLPFEIAVSANLLLALALHLDRVAAHLGGQRDRVAADLARVLDGHRLAVASRTFHREREIVAIDRAILDGDIRTLAARGRAGEGLAVNFEGVVHV